MAGHDEMAHNVWSVKDLVGLLYDWYDGLPVILCARDLLLACRQTLEIKDKSIDDAMHLIEQICIEIAVGIEQNLGTLLSHGLMQFFGDFEHKRELHRGFTANPLERFGHVLVLEILRQSLCIRFGIVNGQSPGLETKPLRACRTRQIASCHINDECRNDRNFLAQVHKMLINPRGGVVTAETAFALGAVDMALARAEVAGLEPFFE